MSFPRRIGSAVRDPFPRGIGRGRGDLRGDYKRLKARAVLL
jgi:hypothetical protein